MSDVVEEEARETSQENSTDSPGEQLKRARLLRNLEQEDIAKELKLDLRFVQALEDGRLNELPQPVYTAGYIRAYSKLVGLAPDAIVAKYTEHQKASAKNTVTEKEHIPSHYRHVQNSLPKSFSVGHDQSDDKRKFNLLISVLAIVVVFAIIWQVSQKRVDTVVPVDSNLEGIVKPGSNGENKTGVPEMGEATKINSEAVNAPDRKSTRLSLPNINAQSSDNNTSGIGDQNKLANVLLKNANKITEISLHYEKDSWVDIRDATGKAIIRRLGVAGGSNTVSGIAPFEVLLGYSPGVSIKFDGKPYDMSAFNKQRVARFVLNDDKKLEQSDTKRSKENASSFSGGNNNDDF